MKSNKTIWLILFGVILWIICILVLLNNLSLMNYIFRIIPEYTKSTVVTLDKASITEDSRIWCKVTGDPEKDLIYQTTRDEKWGRSIITNKTPIIIDSSAVVECAGLKTKIDPKMVEIFDNPLLSDSYSIRTHYKTFGLRNSNNFYIFGHVESVDETKVSFDKITLLTSFTDERLKENYSIQKTVYIVVLSYWVISIVGVLIWLLIYKLKKKV